MQLAKVSQAFVADRPRYLPISPFRESGYRVRRSRVRGARRDFRQPQRLAQAFKPAVRPVGDARADGRI